jgi:peptide/nickel transport system permease protein
MKRILGSILVLLAIVVLNFVLFRIVPGDPTLAILDPKFSPEAKMKLAAQWGLDRPLYEQFVVYAKNMLTFDFGISFLSSRPVWDEISSRLPNTVSLLGTSFLLSAVLGIWIGIKAALARGTMLERAVLFGGAVSFSFPSFFVQLVLLMLFASFLQIFPLRGSVSIPPPQGAALIFDRLWHLALPVISLTILSFGGWALYVRNLMVKAMGEDFILMARAKGLSERRIVWHAFRSVLPPIITILLLALPGIVSGAVITETVFSLHGIGRFLIESISGNDYPASEASFFLLGFLTVACNLIADFLYLVVDPRARTRGVSQ